MSEKSYVSLEQKQCAVCGEVYETGSLLTDDHLRLIFNKFTVTGQGLCPTHQALHDQGYVALIAVANSTAAASLKDDEANRTGQLAHLSRRVARELFSAPFPDDMPMCYIDAAVYAKLEELHKSLEP